MSAPFPTLLIVDPRSIRSISIVQEVVRDEREAQLRHFDGLDAKSGIVLGFGGVLVALSQPSTFIVVTLGRGSALVSCFFAILSFWPRRYWSPNVRVLRDEYLAAEPRFAELRLLDTLIDYVSRNNEALVRKARRLKWSMVTLGLAAALVAVGVTLD